MQCLAHYGTSFLLYVCVCVRERACVLRAEWVGWAGSQVTG